MYEQFVFVFFGIFLFLFLNKTAENIAVGQEELFPGIL